MSEQPTLRMESRTERGSAEAGRLRRQGRIPGVLYGQGNSLPVTLDETEFRHTITPSHYGSIIVSIVLDGIDSGSALVKAVQVNTLGHHVMNVDLQRVSQTDLVQMTLPIVLEGEPAAVRSGGVLEQVIHALSVRCRVSEVPAQISFDVSSMQIGDTLRAEQLALPPGCELLAKPEETIAIIAAPTVPITEETVVIEPGVSGPDLAGGKQKDDFPPER